MAALERHRRSPRIERAVDDGPHQDELGAEALRLATGETGQLGAADPVHEAEEVLDQGGVRRLPAGHVVLDDQDVEPVRRRVDGGGQAGRPGADDDEVVVRLLRRAREIPAGGEPWNRRPFDHADVVDDDRQGRIGESAFDEDAIGVGSPDLVKVERLRRPGHEVADPVMVGVERPADHLDVLARWAHR